MSSLFNIGRFVERIFNIRSPDEFNELAMQLFHHQLAHNPVYSEYMSYLRADPEAARSLEEIPFLPITFFKTHKVICGEYTEELVFKSSGTGGKRSKHYIRSADLYRRAFTEDFTYFFNHPENYRFLGLLPSYLSMEGSSLIFMVDDLIRSGNHRESGFYLDDYDKLSRQIIYLSEKKIPTVLIGVSYALLDFAEKYPYNLGDHIVIMETGGMKGRRKEITREDLHKRLCSAFGKKEICSEYGMTELLSQAYSKGHGRLLCPSWMKVMIRDIQDPFSILEHGQTGAINIIDLANMHSCAFIETQDLGRTYPDGSFDVLGRTDTSDIRGCNLMLA